jgi:hypothetical protein
MRRILYAYELTPIDEAWDLLPTAADVASRIAARLIGRHGTYALTELQDFAEELREALRAGEGAGFDGVFREGEEVRVFSLPDGENGFARAYAWKQDNNGTSYVVSPYPLQHLGAPAFAVERGGPGA